MTGATAEREEAAMSHEAVSEAADEAPSTPERWIDWLSGFGIILYHALVILALTPWFFSWTGVALMLFGIYFFGMLGINLGYHRLLTHRSFTCPRWLEYTLAIIGLCSFQDSPAYWAAIHRRHHQFADVDEDPHSPVASLLWAHVGWIVLRNQGIERRQLTERYTRDLMRQPFYAWLETYWMPIVIAHWILFFAGGTIAGTLMGMPTADALRFGTSVFLWGVVVRTVATWHIAWAINSVTHCWGYRNYQTPDESRNNVLMGYVGAGEGWHNNHHAYPSAAMHGHRWWEADPVFWVIRGLAAVGLAKDVRLPGPHHG
jgi:fatty-acid desaturase